jgi:homoserine kinase type II
MKLMDQLNDLKIRCPKPLKNYDGKYLFKIKNKVACVVSFLDGKDKKNLSLKNCYDIGKTVAQMHSSSKKIRLFRKNSMNIKNLNPLLKSIKFKSKKFINLEKFLKSNFREIKNKWPKKLPNGIIHGDLFIDNIFFKKNKISGIIDFYFAANDYFMYEIAICINALCFDKKKSQFKLNKKKVKNLIRGYESIKKISGIEKKSLNILCRAAAMRYFLTRLYDYTNTPKTALIKIKDPREYYQKLIIHNNLKNYRDYLG